MAKVSQILYGIFYTILIATCCNQIYACLMTEYTSASQVVFLTNDEDVQVKFAADLCISSPILQRVISFEAMKKKEKTDSVVVDIFRQFMPQTVKLFIKSLAIRKDHKALHTLFDYEDILQVLELSHLSTFIHDEELLEACADAFVLTIMQPSIVQTIEADVIEKIKALPVDFESFKKKSVQKLLKTMGEPLCFELQPEKKSSCEMVTFDGKNSLIALNLYRTVQVYSMRSGKLLHKFDNPEHQATVNGGHFNEASDKLVTFASCHRNDPCVYVWDLQTDKLVMNLEHKLDNSEYIRVDEAFFIKNGQQIITSIYASLKPKDHVACYRNIICVWDLSSKAIVQTMQGRIICFNAPLALIAIYDGALEKFKVLNVLNGDILLERDKCPHGYEFTTHGDKMLLSIVDDRYSRIRIELWDLLNKRICSFLEGPFEEYKMYAMNESGTHFATCYENKARVWDISKDQAGAEQMYYLELEHPQLDSFSKLQIRFKFLKNNKVLICFNNGFIIFDLTSKTVLQKCVKTHDGLEVDSSGEKLFFVLEDKKSRSSFFPLDRGDMQKFLCFLYQLNMNEDLYACIRLLVSELEKFPLEAIFFAYLCIYKTNLDSSFLSLGKDLLPPYLLQKVLEIRQQLLDQKNANFRSVKIIDCKK